MKEGFEKKAGLFNFINNRGQVAIFIVIGVLLVSAFFTFLVFENQASTNSFNVQTLNPNVKPINSFVLDCINSVGNDAIYQIGKTGGYVISPEPRLVINEGSDDSIAFYLYDEGYLVSDSNSSSLSLPSVPSPAKPSLNDTILKENYMPSEDKIQTELSKYMNNFLYFCINDFSDFSEFNITSGEVKTQTIIERSQVVFKVNYPIQISKDNRAYTIENFEVSIPARLNETYFLTKEIMENQMKKPSSICMSCIYDLANKSAMKVKLMDSEEGIVFAVVDSNSKINNADYIFYFANKYN